MTRLPTLMVRVVAGMPNDAVLALAADLATRLEVLKVIGISARQPIQVYGGFDMAMPADLLAWDFEQIGRELKAAEAEFRWAFEGKAAELEWRSAIAAEGSIVDYVTGEMRAADLLVTTADEDGSLLDGRRLDLADLVLRAGRPVLLAGPGQNKLDLTRVVVGWTESREARRTVLDAVPLLSLAERVSVVELVAEEDFSEARTRTEDVAQWLAGRGISACARPIVAKGSHGDQLRDVVGEFELDAGLVVGGAYGHTRLREWVLGGVTRDFLLRPTRCSLVSH